LVSFDAISLVTNIPIDLALENISIRWTYISPGYNIPKNSNSIITNYGLYFFTFSNNLYKHKFGTPMYSPLSPIIADLVLQDFEGRALEIFGIEMPFYFRYVDDIAMAVHHTQLDSLFNIFNSFH